MRGRLPATVPTRTPAHPATSSSIGLLALLVLFVASVVVPASPAGAQAPGLVAAYGFDETSGTTVEDKSGNANTGTLGSGVTRTTAGRFGGALVFDGTGFVTVPN